MTILIIVFGLLIVVAGMVILIRPEIVFDALRDNSEKLGLQISAVAVRAVLGLLLIFQSSVSRFPIVIEAIGWLALVAAIVLAVIGRRNFSRLMSWAMTLVAPLGRVAGALAVAFGTFLVYAFV